MHSPQAVKHLKHHALAVLFVLLALVLTLALQAVASRAYYILFVPAVMLAAWFGGLLTNAVKFIDAGGAVYLTVEQEPSEVAFGSRTPAVASPLIGFRRSSTCFRPATATAAGGSWTGRGERPDRGAWRNGARDESRTWRRQRVHRAAAEQRAIRCITVSCLRMA